MLRRVLTVLGLLAATFAIANAQVIDPNLTGRFLPDIMAPQDPSQFIARENSLRREINGNFLLNDYSNANVGDTYYAINFTNPATQKPCLWSDPAQDVGPCINTASDAAVAGSGGRVVIPAGAFALATTITRRAGVFLEGAGAATNQQCGTKLTWTGVAGATMVTALGTNAAPMSGGGLVGLCFYGNDLTATIVDLRGVSHGLYQNLYMVGYTGIGMYRDAPSGSPVLTQNVFIDVNIDGSAASSITARGLVDGPGTATTDVNRNVWIGGSISHQNGVGFDCFNEDGNSYYNMSVKLAGGGSSQGVVLNGAGSAVTQSCRENVWLQATVGAANDGGFTAKAGAVTGCGGGGVNPCPSSFGNQIYGLKTGDGEQVPTIEAGAQLYWLTSSGGLNLYTAPGTSTFGHVRLGRDAALLGPFLDVDQATTGSPLQLEAGGADTNIAVTLDPKGTGTFTTRLPGYASGCGLKFIGNTTFDVFACATAGDNAPGQIMQPFGAPTVEYTKSTAAWSSGNNGGCLDTGAIATSTWYYVFHIQRLDTHAVDDLCSASSSSPTMPTSYTIKRLIGVFKTDGSSNILPFRQVGNEYTWTTPVQDFATTTLGTGASVTTLASVPSGLEVTAKLRATLSHATLIRNLLIKSPGATGGTLNSPVGNVTCGMSVNAVIVPCGEIRVVTNTSQQVTLQADGTNTIVNLVTAGFSIPDIMWPH